VGQPVQPSDSAYANPAGNPADNAAKNPAIPRFFYWENLLRISGLPLNSIGLSAAAITPFYASASNLYNKYLGTLVHIKLSSDFLIIYFAGLAFYTATMICRAACPEPIRSYRTIFNYTKAIAERSEMLIKALGVGSPIVADPPVAPKVDDLYPPQELDGAVAQAKAESTPPAPRGLGQPTAPAAEAAQADKPSIADPSLLRWVDKVLESFEGDVSQHRHLLTQYARKILLGAEAEWNASSERAPKLRMLVGGLYLLSFAGAAYILLWYTPKSVLLAALHN